MGDSDEAVLVLMVAVEKVLQHYLLFMTRNE
jgi:hypothetical protein